MCLENQFRLFPVRSSSLLFAKFVPGLNTIAPPIAGMFRLAPWKFIMLDSAGALAWAAAFTAIGWIFREQLEVLAIYLERFGAWLGIGIASGLALYTTIKYIQRRSLYRGYGLPDRSSEFKERMDAGEHLTIVDLRNAIEKRDGGIPGALQLTEESLESMSLSLAKMDIILYCSCPNEFGSARAAMRLKRLGIQCVHPLEGGFPLWRELGFPVERPDLVHG